MELEGDEMELEEGFVWVKRTSPANSTLRVRDYEAHTDQPFNPSMDGIHGVDDACYIARRAVAGAAVMGLTMSPYAQAVPPT